MRRAVFLLIAALALAGCGTGYVWRSQVPKHVRTVAVPVFRNGSDVTELGSVMTRELLRELQREGTFKIARGDRAALEIQGEVLKATSAGTGYDRRGSRLSTRRIEAEVRISVVDKTGGAILVNNRMYRAEADYEINQDTLTGRRNASGRLGEDLARQVVDDLLRLPYEAPGREKGEGRK